MVPSTTRVECTPHSAVQVEVLDICRYVDGGLEGTLESGVQLDEARSAQTQYSNMWFGDNRGAALLTGSGTFNGVVRQAEVYVFLCKCSNCGTW